MANNGYTRELAASSVAEGAVDLVAFGRPFIANPDLVERFRTHSPLALADAGDTLRWRRKRLYGLPGV